MNLRENRFASKKHCEGQKENDTTPQIYPYTASGKHHFFIFISIFALKSPSMHKHRPTDKMDMQRRALTDIMRDSPC